jgi:hypothetical protein
MDTHFMSANNSRTMLVPTLRKHVPELLILALGVTLFILSVRYTLLDNFGLAVVFFVLAVFTTITQMALRHYSVRKCPRAVFSHDRINPAYFQSTTQDNIKIPMINLLRLELTCTVIPTKQGEGYEEFELSVMSTYSEGKRLDPEPDRIFLCRSRSRDRIMKIADRISMIAGLKIQKHNTIANINHPSL